VILIQLGRLPGNLTHAVLLDRMLPELVDAPVQLLPVLDSVRPRDKVVLVSVNSVVNNYCSDMTEDESSAIRAASLAEF